MRISDWSSDVCSSDLRIARLALFLRRLVVLGDETGAAIGSGKHTVTIKPRGALFAAWRKRPLLRTEGIEDRKSVVSGKSVSVRVDLGGRRTIKKKHTLRQIDHM